MRAEPDRIRAAWEGRVSGCQLGKPVELLSMSGGHAALAEYLAKADAVPLRDYVPLVAGVATVEAQRACCRGELRRAEPDDDLNYSVLALMMLEQHGAALTTADVARSWMLYLPPGQTFTAERAAYRTLLAEAHEWFAQGAEPGFDLGLCAKNAYDDWIGAQIRADLYGWVCPGEPARAAALARVDAALSHRGDGIHGAAFVAALGAAIPAEADLEVALARALSEIPEDSGAADAVALGREHAGSPDGAATIRRRYEGMSPVHTLNNLALVVWALLSWPDDFGAAVGEVVAAGLDTDCNGATVGGLWGLQGRPVPEAWTAPWQGRVGLSLAGLSELRLESLVDRTLAVAARLAG
jgi:ADP-ribosylglycohydrolase